jgi:hypothetical protein
LTTDPAGPFASTVEFGGTPENVGGVVSTNTTVTVNEAVAVLWAVSSAVQFTVVVPTAKVEPEEGAQLTVGGVPLSSPAETEYVTTAPPGSDVCCEMLGGGSGVNVGGVVSLNVTVTVKLALPVFP